MTYEVFASDGYSQPKVGVHSTESPSSEASFAFSLIERWGLVAAAPDGEDSSGRSKLRVLTAEELATRAFDASDAAFAEARKRGLMLEIPTMAELKEMDREHNGRNR